MSTIYTLPINIVKTQRGTMKGRMGGTPLGVGNANDTRGLSFLPEVGYTLPL